MPREGCLEETSTSAVGNRASSNLVSIKNANILRLLFEGLGRFSSSMFAPPSPTCEPFFSLSATTRLSRLGLVAKCMGFGLSSPRLVSR